MMASVILGISYHADVFNNILVLISYLMIFKKSYCSSDPDHYCAVSGSKLCHQCKMAVLIFVQLEEVEMQHLPLFCDPRQKKLVLLCLVADDLCNSKDTEKRKYIILQFRAC